MSNWMVSIGAVIIITSIITIILPNGKTCKLIKGIFSIIISLVIFSPIINLYHSDYNYADYVINEIEYQDDFLYFTNDIKVKYLSADLKKLLNLNELCCEKIDINFVTNEDGRISIKKVKIYLTDMVINSEDEHIYIIEEAVKLASEFLHVEKRVIDIVYG